MIKNSKKFEESDYREYIDIMVCAENMVKEKRSGFCYLRPERFDDCQLLCNKIGIDFMVWLNTYFDYENFN